MHEGPALTPPRRRRRHRALGWIVWPIVLLAGLYLLAASYAPSLVDQAVARAVSKQIGSPVSAQVTSVPFWEVAYGRFNRLQVRAARISLQGITVTNADLVWRNGQVDVSALEKGKLRILRRGTLTLSATIPQDVVESSLTSAVRPYLPAGATVTLPQVVVRSAGVSLDGSVNVLGVSIPYRLDGVLEIAAKGDSLDFQTRSLNGSALHLPAVPVLAASQLPKVDGITWRFRGVSLHAGSIAVTLQSAP